VLELQRKASFYVDWVEAENSAGFHAPQESARILADSIDASRRGQILLRDVLSGKTSGEESASAASENTEPADPE